MCSIKEVRWVQRAFLFCAFSMLDDPSYQLSVPAHYGLRLEDANDLTELGGCSVSYRRQLGRDYGNSESHNAGGTYRLTQRALSLWSSNGVRMDFLDHRRRRICCVAGFARR